MLAPRRATTRSMHALRLIPLLVVLTLAGCSPDGPAVDATLLHTVARADEHGRFTFLATLGGPFHLWAATDSALARAVRFV